MYPRWDFQVFENILNVICQLAGKGESDNCNYGNKIITGAEDLAFPNASASFMPDAN